MIRHIFKVALRNLMKYKLQTVISILSIAIGIVTLAFAHSILKTGSLSHITDLPYIEQSYNVGFTSAENSESKQITPDILRALKNNGGLKSAEKIAINNLSQIGLPAYFELSDSTVRKGQVNSTPADLEFLDFVGFRSALTGEKIRRLKPGEAIISENLAKEIFKDSDPIGAVQVSVNDIQTIPVKIVDIYEPVSLPGASTNDEKIYFCSVDQIEDFPRFDYIYSTFIYVVLRKGATEKQLLNEINARVNPLGLEAYLSKTLDAIHFQDYYAIRVLVYTISSLILLAGIIGFIRMQIQLFRVRRRELSLRTVNGAKRFQLFTLLFTEIFIAIALSAVVAAALGILLQDFVNSQLDFTGYKVNDLWVYSIAIGSILLVICSLISWFSLCRLCKRGNSLAENMRRSRNHIFRNVMLCFQIAISIVFVCATFIMIDGGAKIIGRCNVPDNDDFYRECLTLKPDWADSPERLIDEIKRLPDIDKVLMACSYRFPILEVRDKPDAVESRPQHEFFDIYCTTDTTLLSFFKADVNWLRNDVDRNRCMLVGEDLYRQFQELGILDNGNLTFLDWTNEPVVLPVAGTISNIPYDRTSEYMVAITPDWNKMIRQFTLVPKPGKGKALAREVDETIARIEPEIINKMVFKYTDTFTMKLPMMVKSVRTGGCILGVVSLIICAMSIFSTIALDTRARKKEVAIRKINGAKGKDIYRMFGRIYLILIVIALIVAVPLSIFFCQFINSTVLGDLPEYAVSAITTITLGVFVVSLLIFLIVSWQIYKVMRIDPAEVIAKE